MLEVWHEHSKASLVTLFAVENGDMSLALAQAAYKATERGEPVAQPGDDAAHAHLTRTFRRDRDLVTAVREITNGRGVDLVVDLVGNVGRADIRIDRPAADAGQPVAHPCVPGRVDPNGVYVKLCNFLRLDPAYAGVGLGAGSKLDEVVWEEFADNAERLRALAEAIRASRSSEEFRPAALPEVEDDGAPEGQVLLRQHQIRERSSALTRKKKVLALRQLGALRCEVCNLVFAEVYGPIGEGFIECHHVVPLSKLRPGQATRLADLALVCANCHRMLHRGGEQVSIAVLRERVVEQAQGSRRVLPRRGSL
jgi:5-methylcytosine-specific restriction enzyme A